MMKTAYSQHMVALDPDAMAVPRATSSFDVSTRRSALLALAIAVACGSVPAFGAPVLVRSDGFNESSFANGTNFSPPDNVTPLPTVDYSTAGFQILTPGSTADQTFTGRSLTVNAGGVLVTRAGNFATVTVEDLRMEDGSRIVVWESDGGALRRAELDGAMALSGVVTINPIRGDRDSRIRILSTMTGTGGVRVVSAGVAGAITAYSGADKSYSGDTQITDGGVLVLGGTNILPDIATDGDLIVDASGTVRLFDNTQTTQGLAGVGIVENGGAGTSQIVLQGDQDAVNNIFGGTLRDGTGGGTLSVTKTGETTSQEFSGANTYTGGTSIEGGTLKITNDEGLGTGGVSISGGTLELDPVTINNNLSFIGKADLTPHLLASDAGNIVNGDIALQDGGNATDNFNVSAASGGSLTINGAITDSVTAATNDSLNFLGDGDITMVGAITLDDGTDAITKDGSGTLTLSGGASADTVSVDGGQLNLASTLTTTGGVSVASGATLQQQGGGFIDRTTQAGDFDVDGTVDLNGEDASMNVLTGAGVVDNTASGPATLTLNSDTGGTFEGTIQDSGTGALGIVKDGAGTQDVGTVNIAGTIDVDGGSLAVTGTTTSGAIDVASGAGLTMTGAASTGAITSSGDIDADALVTTNGNTVTIDDGTADFSAGLNTGSANTTVNDGEASITDYTGGILDVNGGLANMSGTGNFGAANVSGGALNVLSQDALDGSGATNVSGAGQVNISDASITTDFTDIDEIFNLAASGGGVQLNNVANENTITGSVNLVASTPAGQEQFRIESESGTLNLDGGVVSSLTGGNEILNLGGAGNGTVESLDMTTANASGIVKDGDGEWTLSNATMDNANEIVSQGGVLALADAANIDGAAIFDLAGGSLNVAGVTGGSSYDAGAFDGNGAFLIQSGQTLTGNGAVTGDMVVAGDLDIGSSFGEMVFGNLDLNGTVTIEVGGPAQNGLFNDLLRVTSLLDIVGASLVFDVVGALTRPAYVFATYGSLVPATGPFLKVTGKPDGWSVVYGYGGEDQIALVNDAPPLPAPGPLALIGLGALVWGGLRRRASRDATAS
jgi:fibronectin-binding autotransporter adhesin